MKNFVVGPGCFLPGQPKSFLLKIGRKLRGEYVAAWWTKMPISSFFFFFSFIQLLCLPVFFFLSSSTCTYTIFLIKKFVTFLFNLMST